MLLPLYDDNPTTRTPYVTYGLIVINLAVMLWLAQMPQLQQQIESVKHGFIPRRIQQLSDPNLVLQIAIEPEHRFRDPFVAQQQPPPPIATVQLDPAPAQVIESVLTSMFMHGGWLHVLGNMWFLYIFGNNIEDRLGSVLYSLFYLLGGTLATACHWAYDPSSTIPMIGASGAVATILGAYAVTYPKAKVHTLVFLGIITSFEIPALVWLGIWFVGELVSALFMQDMGVAVWAHVGGFGVGVLLMPLLSLGCPPPGSQWHEEVKKSFAPPPTDWS